MSYVKLPLGGKERGLKFNQLAMQEFSLNYGRHEKLSAENPELFLLYNVFHAGLIGNCKATGEEPDFTFFDVINWVDELYEEQRDQDARRVVSVFAETRSFKETAKAIIESEVEKKSPPKKRLKNTGTSA